MKAKTRKNAFIVSIVSVLICLTMLIGTSFAWFSDVATTGVNTIQSGILDVAILDEQGASLEGESLDFIVPEEGSAFIVGGLLLWEPGVTFNTPKLKLANNGNLALKYKLSLNGIEGDSLLLDVISFSVVDSTETAVALGEYEGYLAPGEETELFYIQGHMDEAANNTYQNLTLQGIGLLVSAAQDTYEFDSTDDQYDAAATYAAPGGALDANGILLATLDELAEAGTVTIVDGILTTYTDDPNIETLVIDGATVSGIDREGNSDLGTDDQSNPITEGPSKIVITDGVSYIDTKSFLLNQALTEVELPAGITVGRSAFQSAGLTSLVLPADVVLTEAAFRDCKNLTSVTIPEGVTALPKRVFGDCYSLTTITLPTTCISIGDVAFRDCRDLTDIYILADECSFVGTQVFMKNVTGSVNLTVHVKNETVKAAAEAAAASRGNITITVVADA